MKSNFSIILGLFFVGFVCSSFEGCWDPTCDLKFSGKVMDEDGKPLQGIKVEACKVDSFLDYYRDSLTADTFVHRYKPCNYYLGQTFTNEEGEYEISASRYEDLSPSGEYRLVVLDTSDVYAPDSTESLQWFKVAPGKRRDDYNGAYLAQYRFALKKK